MFSFNSTSTVELCVVRYVLSVFTVQYTESFGVEHLSKIVGSQRVDGQDALVRKTPLAAGNEDCQQLSVCRDVAAGIVVDLTVWHKNVDGGWAGHKRRERSHCSIWSVKTFSSRLLRLNRHALKYLDSKYRYHPCSILHKDFYVDQFLCRTTFVRRCFIMSLTSCSRSTRVVFTSEAQ